MKRNLTIVSKRPVLRGNRIQKSKNLKRKNETHEIPNMSSMMEMNESKVS